MINYEALPGDHIEVSAKEACDLARKEGVAVQFEFNGVRLKVSIDSEPFQIVEKFHAELERKSREYKASPEGIASADKRREQVAKNNAKIESLMSALPLILIDGTADNLLDWLIALTPLADDVGSSLNKEWLADKLVEAGHIRNDLIGFPPEFYNTKQRMLNYIVGQVLDALYRGMPPHPITVSFSQKAKLLP